MAKAKTWEEEISNLIGSLTGSAKGSSNNSSAPEEAAIVGGGVAGSFKAQQMADRKAADLARRSAGDPSARPTTAIRPTGSALTTTGNTGGGLTTTGTSSGLITQGAQPNTSVIKSGRTPFADPSTLRNATPRSGAGIGSVLSGGAVLNPVVAGLAATAAMTGQAGKGSEVVLEGSTADMIRNPAKYGYVSPDTTSNSKEPKTAESPYDFQGPTRDAPVSSTSQRTPDEQKVADIYGFVVPLAAPKAIPVAEPVAAPVAAPVDTDRAAMLFAKTHGSAFDPKSSMDKKKMAAITNLMGQEGSEALTPNQFALKIYRTTKK